MRAQRLGVLRPSLAQFDDRVDDLSEALVRQPEDRGIDDVRMAGEPVLDFGGIDVHPAAQDEVDATIGQEQITVVVEPSEISDGERRRVGVE